MSNRFQSDEPEREIYRDPDEEHDDGPLLRELAYPAFDESGTVIGEIFVDMNDDGTTPSVVSDESGATWLLVRNKHDVGRYYQRVARVVGQFVVRQF